MRFRGALGIRPCGFRRGGGGKGGQGECSTQGSSASAGAAEYASSNAAGELGHRGARSRVLALLLPTDDALVVAGRFTDGSRQTLAKIKRRATEIASHG